MKPSKKQKGLDNIYYLLEKEGVGEVVKLPKDFWENEFEKFCAAVGQSICGIEIFDTTKNKLVLSKKMKGTPCEKCKKQNAICTFRPCVKLLKWLLNEKD